MLSINIGMEWEEFESNGEICSKCKEIITGNVYILMLQVGGPMDAKPVAYFCKACGDATGTKTGEFSE